MLSSLPFKAMAGARAAVPDPTGVFSVLVHTFSWWNGDSLKFAKTALEMTSTLNQFPAEIFTPSQDPYSPCDMRGPD